MKNLFILAHTGWEDWNPYYFEGPGGVSQDEFKELCQSFVERAGYNATVRPDLREDFIGWNEVVESMVPLLEKAGYCRFNPKECTFAGRNIIDDLSKAEGMGSAADAIIAHNKRIRDSF